MTFWRQPQGRENKIEATAKQPLEPLCPCILLDTRVTHFMSRCSQELLGASCPWYTFGHLDHTLYVKVSPRATSFWPLESSPLESSDLLILTCTNATARVLNNASIFINESWAHWIHGIFSPQLCEVSVYLMIYWSWNTLINISLFSIPFAYKTKNRQHFFYGFWIYIFHLFYKTLQQLVLKQKPVNR